jgi:hypothetical protein
LLRAFRKGKLEVVNVTAECDQQSRRMPFRAPATSQLRFNFTGANPDAT